MRFIIVALALMAMFSTASEDFVADYAEELEISGKKGENLAQMTEGWDVLANKGPENDPKRTNEIETYCPEGQELNDLNKCVYSEAPLDEPQIIKFPSKMFSKVGNGWCSSSIDGSNKNEMNSNGIDGLDMKKCAKECLKSADCVAYAFAERYQQDGVEYKGRCEIYGAYSSNYGLQSTESAHYRVRSSTGQAGVKCYKKMDTNESGIGSTVVVEPPSVMFLIIGKGICVDAEGELPNGKMIDSKTVEECRQECVANTYCTGYSTVKGGKGRCFVFGRDEINNNIAEAVDYEESFNRWAAFSGRDIKIKLSDDSYSEFQCHRLKTSNEVLNDINYVFSKVGRGSCIAKEGAEHEIIESISKKDCFLECQDESICTGFDYDDVHAICTTYAQTHAIIDYSADRSHVCYAKYDHGRKLRKAIKKVELEAQIGEYSETEMGYAKMFLLGLFICLSSLVIYDQIRKKCVSNNNNLFHLVDEAQNMTPYYQEEHDRI